MQIARELYSLGEEHNDSALILGAHRALAATLYYLGDFESARQYAKGAVEIWRSGGVRSSVEEVMSPTVVSLCMKALSEWHIQGFASCQATIAEAMSLADSLTDLQALAIAQFFAAFLAHFEGNAAEVERLTSTLIELATRQNFAFWLPGGKVLRGWALSVRGNAMEGISWIEEGIEDWRATGATRLTPYYLAMKAEALHLAERDAEALEAIKQAGALSEKFQERWWCAELSRLRAVFLKAIGAEANLIEVSFCEAIRIARDQKSSSLATRAEATYAEYHGQKREP